MPKDVSVKLEITADPSGARNALKQLLGDLAGLGDAGARNGKAASAALEELAAALENAESNSKKLAATQNALDQLLLARAIPQKQYNTLLEQAKQLFSDTAPEAGKASEQAQRLTETLAASIPSWRELVAQGGLISRTLGQQAVPAFTLITRSIGAAGPLVGTFAAALGALALAYKQGSVEADAYNRALIMSGNAAGASAGQLADMARQIGQTTDATQGKAAGVLAQLAGTGEVAASKLQQVTQVAIDLEKYAGQSVATTVQQFEALGKAPVQASLKLNEQYRYLTVAVYDQIKALEDQGRKEDAAQAAQDAYSSAMASRTAKLEQNLGAIERAWRSVTDTAKGAWDAMLGVGRKDTNIDKLRDLGQQLVHEQSRITGGLYGSEEQRQRNVASLIQQISNLSILVEKEEDATRAEAAKNKVQQDGLAAKQANQRWSEAALTTQEKINKELEKYRQNNERIRAAGGTISPDQVQKEEAAVRKSFAAKGGSGPSARADANTAIAQIKADMDLLQASVKEGDSIVVQALKEGQVSIDGAYQARLAMLKAESAAQRQAIEDQIAEIDKALAKAKPSERAALTQKRIQLEAQLQLNQSSLSESTRKLDQWKVEQERNLATITAQVQVQVASITGKFNEKAVREQLDAQFRPTLKAAGRENDPERAQALREQVTLLTEAGVQQAKFNDLLAQAQRLQSALSVQEQTIQVERDKGNISQIEAETRITQARAAQIPALDAIIAKLREMRDAMPPEADVAIDQMSVSIGQLQNTVSAATPSVVTLGTQIKNTMTDSLADAAANSVSNFKSLGEIVSGVLRQIAGEIMRSGIKGLLADQFKVGDSGSGGGIFGALFSAGKSLFGFAEGGHIRGPGTGTSDSIPALVDGRMPIAVSDGEYIHPTRAVRHYGLGFMEAVRTLRLPKPRYGFGGLVAAHQSAQRAQRARFATGGAVTGAAGAQLPPMTIRLNNTGAPKQASEPKVSRESGRYIIDVLLDDIRAGGRGIQGIKAGLQRG